MHISSSVSIARGRGGDREGVFGALCSTRGVTRFSSANPNPNPNHKPGNKPPLELTTTTTKTKTNNNNNDDENGICDDDEVDEMDLNAKVLISFVLFRGDAP